MHDADTITAELLAELDAAGVTPARLRSTADLAADLPLHGHFAREPKLDGLRCWLVVTAAGARLVTRSGRVRALRLDPWLAGVTAPAGAGALMLDGELVTATGPSTITAVQRAATPRAFVAFDCLRSGGAWLYAAPWFTRIEALGAMFDAGAFTRQRVAQCGRDMLPGRLPIHAGTVARLLERADAAGAEGWALKPCGEPYAGGLYGYKLKRADTADGVVCGVRTGPGNTLQSVGVCWPGAAGDTGQRVVVAWVPIPAGARPGPGVEPVELCGRVVEFRYFGSRENVELLRSPQFVAWRDDKPAADCRRP